MQDEGNGYWGQLQWSESSQLPLWRDHCYGPCEIVHLLSVNTSRPPKHKKEMEASIIQIDS